MHKPKLHPLRFLFRKPYKILLCVFANLLVMLFTVIEGVQMTGTRIAFARAMALDNPVILADEPTANLDKDAARVVAEILQSLAHTRGKLVIAATHDPFLAECADLRFFLHEGFLERR